MKKSASLADFARGSKDKRVTQRVHEIAAELENWGGAKSFDMVSPPHLTVVDKSIAGVLQLTTLKQVVPNAGRTFSPAQFEALFKHWF